MTEEHVNLRGITLTFPEIKQLLDSWCEDADIDPRGGQQSTYEDLTPVDLNLMKIRLRMLNEKIKILNLFRNANDMDIKCLRTLQGQMHKFVRDLKCIRHEFFQKKFPVKTLYTAREIPDYSLDSKTSNAIPNLSLDPNFLREK